MSALEKLLKGEVLTEEEKNSLTPEEIAQAKQKELDAVVAIRAERQRLETKKAEDERNHSESFQKRFLDEQVTKAETQAFSDLTNQGIELTEEKKAKIRDMRKKIDSGSVTYENIVEDFLSAAAAIERGTLFEDRKKRMTFEKNAAEYTALGAGPNGSGAPAGADAKTYPQEVWDMVNDAKRQGLSLSPEEALTALTKGNKRVYK